MSINLQDYSKNNPSNVNAISYKQPLDHIVVLSVFYKQLLQDLNDEALIWRVSYDLGGQRMYIPNKVTNQHYFIKYGTSFFNWLVKNYGGQTIIFPCGMNSIYKRNNIQAQLLAERGFSSNAITKQLGIHYRSSQRAKKKARDKLQYNFLDYLK